ncbi:FAD-dependent oxidoreductase [Phycisphaeraceae bacterium D3-23]
MERIPRVKKTDSQEHAVGRPITRRRLLQSAAASLVAPTIFGCASARQVVEPVPGPALPVIPPIVPAPPPLGPLALDPLPIATLPSPELGQSHVVRYVAGLRPYRRGTVRIEHEPLDTKTIIHHYGHGGAGFTLSWGTAEEAADLLARHHAPPQRVAVLGGGVIGLTTAVVLQERGYRVTVYAKAVTPDTTSDLAGAQFAPSLVQCDSDARLNRWVRAAAERFLTLRGDDYGVYERANYTTANAAAALRKLPTDLFPTRQFHRLPFAGPPRSGRVHQTLLIEPPIYLPRMLQRLHEAGGTLLPRTFNTAQDITDLPQAVAVNCLGLGSGELFPDRALSPLRGQLVYMQPQALPYLLSHAGYLFPRKDALVLGGTVERGVNDATPNDRACQNILATHRQFFA